VFQSIHKIIHLKSEDNQHQSIGLINVKQVSNLD